MDYYARTQARRKAAERRAKRIETAKTVGTVVVLLPVLWVFAILFLSI